MILAGAPAHREMQGTGQVYYGRHHDEDEEQELQNAYEDEMVGSISPPEYSQPETPEHDQDSFHVHMDEEQHVAGLDDVDDMDIDGDGQLSEPLEHHEDRQVPDVDGSNFAISGSSAAGAAYKQLNGETPASSPIPVKTYTPGQASFADPDEMEAEQVRFCVFCFLFTNESTDRLDCIACRRILLHRRTTRATASCV